MHVSNAVSKVDYAQPPPDKTTSVKHDHSWRLTSKDVKINKPQRSAHTSVHAHAYAWPTRRFSQEKRDLFDMCLLSCVLEKTFISAARLSLGGRECEASSVMTLMEVF